MGGLAPIISRRGPLIIVGNYNHGRCGVVFDKLVSSCFFQRPGNRRVDLQKQGVLERKREYMCLESGYRTLTGKFQTEDNTRLQ